MREPQALVLTVADSVASKTLACLITVSYSSTIHFPVEISNVQRLTYLEQLLGITLSFQD